MVKVIRSGELEPLAIKALDIRKISEADLQVSPVFVVNQRAFKSGKYRYIVNQGGARSGKTYSILQIILLYVLRNHDKVVDVFRKTHAELAETVVQDFVDIIASLGLSDVVKRNKTKHIFTVNGNIIRFLGIDKAQKRRGSRRDLAYMNEANGMTLDDFVQIKIRTAEALFIDFNPSEYFWANEQILEKENKDDNRHILIKSTYLDNYDFLPYDQIKDIESLIEIDDFYYQVYVLGNLAVMKGKIYTRQEFIEPEVYDVVDYDELYYGLDFGHTNPMALIECKYAQEQVFERERYYQAGKHPEDLVAWMIENNISYTAPIYADPAFPSGIAKLRDAGFNVRRAKKDVIDGIAYCQGIVPKICKSSTHYIRERQAYKWRQTVSGTVLEGEPVKLNDHLCFIGETLVTTDRGAVRIDQVRPGDKVLTSKGFKKVLRFLDNGERQVQSYLLQFDTVCISLVCTPDHRVKTDQGWQEISKLKSGTTVNLTNFSGVKNSFCSQGKNISGLTVGPCIKKFSRRFTASAPRVTIYTTRTRTNGTTGRKTSSSKKLRRISASMFASAAPIGLKNFKRPGYLPPPPGTPAPRVSPGIVSTRSKPGKTGPRSKRYASNAGQDIKRSSPKNPSFAIQTAKLRRFEPGEKSIKRVYDLTVEGSHEYFANGILCHNCDAERYAQYTHRKRLEG